jgi:hypothetical protein
MKHSAIRWHWEAAALLIITLLAAALRLYRLPDVPPGLHFDEGFKGVTARGLLEGDPVRLFFESDMGEEPVAMYLVAAAVGLGGQEPWLIRLPSAIVGTLTVPLAWWLGRELFGTRYPRRRGRSASKEAPDRQPGARDESSTSDLAATAGGRSQGGGSSNLQGQIVGLGTALILALLYWHLSFSRIGMEPILVPFFATLAFAALAHGLNTGRRPAFVLSGFALGGSIYTYKAGYFVPILAALFATYAAIVERGFLRQHRRGLLLAALAALIVATPLGLYFVTHPASFLQRPASVAVAASGDTPGSPWQALVDNVPQVLGMFFVRGDDNPRSNLPGRPALDPFLALLLLVGAIRTLVEFRRPRRSLPLLWLGVMAVPTLITDHAPHFGRAIGATPALALLCAWGGWSVWQGASRLERRGVQVAAGVLLGLGLATSGILTGRAYFQTWARSPDLFYAYDVGLVQIADYLNARPHDEHLYLTPTARDHYTLAYLVHRPLATFDGRHGLVVPPPGYAATVVVVLGEDEVTLPALQRTRPDGGITWTLQDGYGQPYAAAYYLPAGDSFPPQPDQPTGAIFGDAAQLLGYSLDATATAPGDTVRLTLYWRSLAPLDDDYTVFTHLLGEHNPATQGPLWAGHDSQPDGGHYPTSLWQPGETILDIHPLTLPADAPPGDYQLEVGLYDLETMARLPAQDGSGHPLPGDAVLLGTIRMEK